MGTKGYIDFLFSQNRTASAKNLILNAISELPLGDFYLYLSRAEFGLGNLSGAQQFADKATKHLPRRSEAWRVRALPDISSGRSAAAYENLKRAAIADPGSASCYVTTTILHRTTNNLSAANRSIRRALQMAPTSAEARRAKAALLFAEGNFKQAAEENRRAILAGPNDARVYYLSGILHQSDPVTAQSFFRKSLTISPTEEGPRTARLATYAQEKRYDRLGQEAHRLILTNPAPPEPYRILAVYPVWANQTISALNLARWQVPLGLDPNSVSKQLAWNLLDVGKSDEAIAIAKFLGREHSPRQEGAYFLGGVLLKSRRYKEAEKVGKYLINFDKADTRGWMLLAEVLYEQGFYKAAERVLKAGLKNTDNNYFVLSQYGKHLTEQANVARATAVFKRALAKEPALPQAYEHLSKAYDALGKEDRAAVMLTRGMKFRGRTATSLAALASMTLMSGDPDRALELVQEAWALQPLDAAVTDSYVNVLITNDEFDEAEHIAKSYYKRFPERIHAACLYATTIAQNGKLKEAVSLIRSRMAQYPRSSELVRAYTTIATWMGRPDIGLPYNERVYRLVSKPTRSRTNIAMLSLWLGRWAKGFDEYETGFEQIKRGRGRKRNFIQSRWEGEDLSGKSIVVHTEQGVGDEIMFATLLGELTKMAEKVYVETTKRMVPLIQTAFPTANVFPYQKKSKEYEQNAEIDYYVPIGSIGRFTRRKQGDFGRNRPYLSPDFELSQALRSKYKAKHRDDLIVGIGWRGGSAPLRRKRRSFQLLDFAPILKHTGVTFVCVQYGDVEDEVAEASATIGKEIIFDPDVDPLKNLVASASQIAACDLVISATNAGVHTAGGLGVPCWALVPFESDWRWTWGRNDVVWYPGMRLFKQKSLNEPWEAVIDRIEIEFADLLDGNQSQLRSEPASDLDW